MYLILNIECKISGFRLQASGEENRREHRSAKYRRVGGSS
jgi:hypothetical protein